MLKLKKTLIHLDPTDYKRLHRMAATLSKTETRKVTASELVRRAVRDFLEKQGG
jgi:hypothetical protein